MKPIKVNEENPSAIPSAETGNVTLDAALSFTPGPWCVQKLNHIMGDLWLQIGLPSGWGPIAGITGDDTAEPTFKPVAGMKYLVTPEAEQWANARLIAAAPALHELAVRVAHGDCLNFIGCDLNSPPNTICEPCHARAALALVEGRQ